MRECPGGCCELTENELVEALRRCRDMAIGGLDRSFFTGSVSACEMTEVVLGRLFELDLCNPPVVVGLLVFALGGGGRIEPLLVVLPVALGGRPIVDVDVLMLRDARVPAGFIVGNRDGD